MGKEMERRRRKGAQGLGVVELNPTKSEYAYRIFGTKMPLLHSPDRSLGRIP